MDSVEIRPPEGGLRLPCFVKCEEIRSLSRERLRTKSGGIGHETLQAVEDRLRILLSL